MVEETKKKTRTRKTKVRVGKNPLYSVTDNGRVVEEAANILDLIIKKFGLKPYLETLQKMLELLLSQVKTYAMFVALKTLIDQFLDQLIKTYQMLSPYLSRGKA